MGDVRVRFTVYGRLRAWRDGEELDLGPPAQQAVLSVLLLRADTTISADALVEALWTYPPRSCRGLVRTYISRARSTVGDGVVATHSGGYCMPQCAVTSDVADIEAHAAVLNSHPDDASRMRSMIALRSALDEARGSPLSGISGSCADAARSRLEQIRLSAHESCARAEVAAGRYQQVIGGVADMVLEHPSREPLVAAYIRALHRVGRSAEALDAFHRTRIHLADELGVHPGDDLQEAFAEAVADHGDPSSTHAVPSHLGQRRYLPNLPAPVGRDDELSGILPATAGGTTLIDGMPGVGKTMLAVYAASELADEFCDGQLFVDLRGHRAGAPALEAVQALEALLRSAGAELPERGGGLSEYVALWHRVCHSRRYVVVLDDAASSEQVRPLIGGGLTHAIVTSRKRLVDIPSDTVVSLTPLSEDQAARLFATCAGSDRVDPGDAIAMEIARLCGELPLALAIMGARLKHRPAWTTAHVRDRLAERSTRLRELRTETLDVGAALELSLASLDSDSARVLQIYALWPIRDLSIDLAAAALNAPKVDAVDVLEKLLDANLLTQSRPERFGVHELVRAYLAGHELVEDPQAFQRAMDQLLHATLIATAADSQARRPIVPVVAAPAGQQDYECLEDREAARRWLGTELDMIIAAVDMALAAGCLGHAWQLTIAIRAFLDRNRLTTAFGDRLEQVLDAAERSRDDRACAHLLVTRGVASALAGRFDQADADFIQAIQRSNAVKAQTPELADEVIWVRDYAATFRVSFLPEQGRTMEAIGQLEVIASTSASPRVVALAYLQQTDMNLMLGRYPESIAAARAGLVVARAHQDIGLTSLILRCGGDTEIARGRWACAAEFLSAALAEAQSFDDVCLARVRMSMGLLAARHGDVAAMEEHFEAAAATVAEHPPGVYELELALRRAEASRSLSCPDSAVAQWQQALRVATRLDMRYEGAWARSGLARARYRAGDRVGGSAMAKEAKDLCSLLRIPDPCAIRRVEPSLEVRPQFT